jgi:transposase
MGGNRSRALTLEQQSAVVNYVTEDCSASLRQIQEYLASNFGIICSEATIQRQLKAFNYSLKRISELPERMNIESTIQTRFLYAQEFYSLLSQRDGENILYIDEVGFNASMRCKRGRAPKGQKAIQIVSQLRTKNISICCAMSKAGTFLYKKQNHAFNLESFLEFMNSVFEKIERNNLGPMIFIMDNVAFHKCAGIRAAIEQKGHVLKFLPPYSPFLNPIENMFSQWKQLVRAERPQNEERLMVIIDEVFTRITSENCNSYYLHMMTYLPRCLERERIEDG